MTKKNYNQNEKIKHYILGFERRTSGAFEHSWNLGQNLYKRGKNINYLTHWWDSPVKEVSLKNESTKIFEIDKLKEYPGVYHLQTHTWEYANHLEKIKSNPDSKLIYNLHAIIPYFYLKGKDKKSFLDGTLPKNIFEEIIKNRLGEREKSQLSAIEKADYLFTISEGHKKVLEKMNVKSPIYVFENVSDFDTISQDSLKKASSKGKEFRDSLNTNNVMIYCGNLYEKKGSFGLFDSLNKIKKEFGTSKLILLGSGQDRVDGLLKVGLKKQDLEDIILVPWINKNTLEGKEEFLKYYYASDVLVQPMITEGLFSKTVIDAMGVGLPTITCKSPYTIGTSENSDEIFSSFVQLKENPKKTKEIVKLAKEKVKTENTWDSYISRMEKIISK